MAKYRFIQSERHAIYSVHGAKCYICGAALTMKTVEIDHVIPESLLDDPDRLAAVLDALGRPDDFGVNSYENWMPACRPCNLTKSNTPWEPSGFVQLTLQNAAAKAEKARDVAERLVTDQSLAKAVAVLEAASESGVLSWETRQNLAPLIAQYEEDRPTEEADEPVRVNPDVAIPPIRILSDDGSVVAAEGPYGRGIGPSGDVSPQMRCSVCGNPYFNGSRCILCGQMDDD